MRFFLSFFTPSRNLYSTHVLGRSIVFPAYVCLLFARTSGRIAKTHSAAEWSDKKHVHACDPRGKIAFQMIRATIEMAQKQTSQQNGKQKHSHTREKQTNSTKCQSIAVTMQRDCVHS